MQAGRLLIEHAAEVLEDLNGHRRTNKLCPIQEVNIWKSGGSPSRLLLLRGKIPWTKPSKFSTWRFLLCESLLCESGVNTYDSIIQWWLLFVSRLSSLVHHMLIVALSSAMLVEYDGRTAEMLHVILIVNCVVVVTIVVSSLSVCCAWRTVHAVVAHCTQHEGKVIVMTMCM